jgi:hypothetical protein
MRPANSRTSGRDGERAGGGAGGRSVLEEIVGLVKYG